MSPTGGIEETGHMVYFNSDFSYVAVLFKGFTITTILNYILACLFILFICLSERLGSYYLENHIKYEKDHSRIRILLTRTMGFSAVMTLRLFYMLITMTMNSQLFVVVVISLTTGQFIVEYIRSTNIYSPIKRKDNNDETSSSNETLGGNESSSTCNKIITGGYTDEEISSDFVISNMNDEENDNNDDNDDNNDDKSDNKNNNNNNSNNDYNEEEDDDYGDEKSALNNSQQRIINSD